MPKTLTSAFLTCCLACATARSDEVYFGGHGDTNAQWAGYSLRLSTGGLTNWTAYTLRERGRIASAPATFMATGSNSWSAIFDEHVFAGNTAAYGLAKHDLRVVAAKAGRSITILDGDVRLALVRMSPSDLTLIEAGRIPMPHGSPLTELALTAGMKREDLETLVADATGTESKYHVYTMHGQREARYQDGETVLVVRFKPGAPAPWIKTKEGNMQHLPPLDATVESWELKRE